MNQALDLKHRPRKFHDVVGNVGVVKLLLRRSQNGSLSGRSMLFGGPKGCGKTSLARIVATAIVCDSLQDGEPCGACASCESVIKETSSNMDEFDAATQGTVDRVRSIIEDLEYGSFDGKPRVVILDEAQRLSKASQDALLKAVEDRRFVIIMCTTEPHKIGEAIRSRLEEYPITPPSESDIITRMKMVCDLEGIKSEPDALTMVARHHKCCPRICLTSLDTLRTLGGATVSIAAEFFRYGSMEQLVDALSKVDSNPANAFELLDHLFSSEGPSWVRDNIVAAVSSELRVKVGAKATYPVRSNFFGARGNKWSDLARVLGSLDRPTAHDIEAAILSNNVISETSKYVAQSITSFGVTTVPQYTAPQPVFNAPSVTHPVLQKVEHKSAPLVYNAEKPIEVVKPALKPAKRSIEIDGVKFTTDEHLTSLDNKIGSAGPPTIHAPSAEVKLDKSRIPIPEKEFARAFIQKVVKDDQKA